jgi:xylan 1,4-beta-xylosidase
VVDATHGSALKAWEGLGRPSFPTRAQIETLREAARMPRPEAHPLANGALTLTLDAHALALVEVSP